MNEMNKLYIVYIYLYSKEIIGEVLSLTIGCLWFT